jgi:ABC-type ATPase with predicted acetyltransferase domain
MACLTWECDKCGAMWHNNDTRSGVCPKCGSDDIYSEYDEVDCDYDDDCDEEEDW